MSISIPIPTDQGKTLDETVAATFEKYSAKLNWGLTPYQPECWAVLDMAIEELYNWRNAEPVAWQHRVRHKQTNGNWISWSAWREGKAPVLSPLYTGTQFEERGLIPLTPRPSP